MASQAGIASRIVSRACHAVVEVPAAFERQHQIGLRPRPSAKPCEPLRAAILGTARIGNGLEAALAEMLAEQPAALGVGEADQHVDGVGR